jgi:hypothetical protein
MPIIEKLLQALDLRYGVIEQQVFTSSESVRSKSNFSNLIALRFQIRKPGAKSEMGCFLGQALRDGNPEAKLI